MLEAVAASEENPFESISSEDMISKTKVYNEKVLERRRKRKEKDYQKEKLDCIPEKEILNSNSEDPPLQPGDDPKANLEGEYVQIGRLKRGVPGPAGRSLGPLFSGA